MDSHSIEPQILHVLTRVLTKQPVSASAIQCSGGDTHLSYDLKVSFGDDQDCRMFVKINRLEFYPLLESESQSLKLLNEQYGLSYPKLIGLERDVAHGYLLLEYHDLRSINNTKSPTAGGRDLARLLAQQHQITSEFFGWPLDNHLGLTEQNNNKHRDWVQFYSSRRLIPQLERAKNNGLSSDLEARISKLIMNLVRYFVGHQPQASLLHGDLWSGNVGVDKHSGHAMMFDPAPYFGDRECDIAFAELFGGFPREFFDHYNELSPLPENYAVRRPIYNLYHALNHFNLFGGVYQSMIEAQLNLIREP